MSETKHTPGPWISDWDDNGFFSIDPIHAFITGCPGDDAEANSHLIAAAPDHALVARLLCSGKLRWEPLCGGPNGELCFNGLRHCTEPDEFGVPKLTDHLRAEIAKAEVAA